LGSSLNVLSLNTFQPTVLNSIMLETVHPTNISSLRLWMSVFERIRILMFTRLLKVLGAISNRIGMWALPGNWTRGQEQINRFETGAGTVSRLFFFKHSISSFWHAHQRPLLFSDTEHAGFKIQLFSSTHILWEQVFVSLWKLFRAGPTPWVWRRQRTRPRLGRSRGCCAPGCESAQHWGASWKAVRDLAWEEFYSSNVELFQLWQEAGASEILKLYREVREPPK
jgi:hypothetical protein